MNRRRFLFALAASLGMLGKKPAEAKNPPCLPYLEYLPGGKIVERMEESDAFGQSRIDWIVRLPNTKDEHGNYVWTYKAPKAV